MHIVCCGVKTVLFINKLSECWCHIINPYLFTKFHTSKRFGKRVTQHAHVHIVLCCGVKTVLFTNRLSKCWCHIINPYLLTKFHTSEHLGKRVSTQTCMFTLFFCCGAKRVLFTNKLSECMKLGKQVRITDMTPTLWLE